MVNCMRGAATSDDEMMYVAFHLVKADFEAIGSDAED